MKNRLEYLFLGLITLRLQALALVTTFHLVRKQNK